MDKCTWTSTLCPTCDSEALEEELEVEDNIEYFYFLKLLTGIDVIPGSRTWWGANPNPNNFAHKTDKEGNTNIVLDEKLNTMNARDKARLKTHQMMDRKGLLDKIHSCFTVYAAEEDAVRGQVSVGGTSFMN